MSADILRELQVPDCLASRSQTGQTYQELLLDKFTPTLEDTVRTCKILHVLSGNTVTQLVQDEKLTLALIKPHLPEGRNLPKDDNEAEAAILAEIEEVVGRERITFRLPFQLTLLEGEEFYDPIRAKYSDSHNEFPNKWNTDEITGQWRSIFAANAFFIASGPLTVLLLEGNNISARWRDAMGHYKQAKADPNTIRGRHGKDEILPNTLVHGSDSPEQVARELGIIVSAIQEFNLDLLTTKGHNRLSIFPQLP